VAGPGSREQFEESYGTDQPLGQLIREIDGLDSNAAKEAFADFLCLGTLSAVQITFINHLSITVRSTRPTCSSRRGWRTQILTITTRNAMCVILRVDFGHEVAG
jgi:hypothetical protein